ncbi:uncharacterized protein VTP21DRAFT_192 [Calcarisporiella thermophila]|uniref:uncharacterized protein n=1 Tax=Calcarisporiella thermophila TaxID=911321 RepID=UPI003741FAB4
MLYMERVTRKAEIDAYTMIIALIYVYRLKKRLSENIVVGEYGFCHKIFTACVLVACKIRSNNEEDVVGTGKKNRKCMPMNTRSMSYVVNNVFTPQEICAMERSLLYHLDYDVLVKDEEVQAFIHEHKRDLFYGFY